jgi:hypothetical protein
MMEGTRDQANVWPLGAHFLIGIPNQSRKNIIECEIDGSVKNERRIEIKLTAIERIRKMSDDLGKKA